MRVLQIAFLSRIFGFLLPWNPAIRFTTPLTRGEDSTIISADFFKRGVLTMTSEKKIRMGRFGVLALCLLAIVATLDTARAAAGTKAPASGRETAAASAHGLRIFFVDVEG